MAGLTLGTAGTIAVGAVAGAAGNVVGQVYTNGSVEPGQVAGSALAGAFGALEGVFVIAAGATEVGGAAAGGAAGAAAQGFVDYINRPQQPACQ